MKTKIVKNLDEYELYGFRDGDSIYVNLTYCWNKARQIAPVNTVDKFTIIFMDTYIHETIHIAIEDATTCTDFAEEYVVRKLTGDTFPKYLQEWYKKNE